MNFVFSVLLTALFFVIFDFFWFSMTLSKIYFPTFFKIQGSGTDIKFIGGVFAWLLLALGIQTFVMPLSNNLNDAIFYGAIYGLIVYGVYNGTNYATLRDYNYMIFAYDLLWGIIICSLVSGIAYKVT